jgi:hypothetical protein
VRRALAALLAAAAAAVALALGASLGAGPSDAAARSPLAGLDRTFRALLPKAGCAEVAARVATAERRRAAALRGARTAKPRVLRAKRAAMKGAVATVRAAAATCAATPPAGGPPGPGGMPPPGTTTGGTPPTPPPAQVITLHVAAGTTFHYTETSATATAGTFRIELHNASDLNHFAGVRAGDGQPTIAESPLSDPRGGVVSVDVTLPAGTYQIFCRNNGHDQLGMKIPLTVTG